MSLVKSQSYGPKPVLPFELAISGEGKKENFTGYSHTVFTFNGFDNIGVKTIELKNKKIDNNEFLITGLGILNKLIDSIVFGEIDIKHSSVIFLSVK